MTELKPCPFCGSKATMTTMCMVDKKPMYQVSCDDPKCRIQPMTASHVSKAVVVREWNRRAVHG